MKNSLLKLLALGCFLSSGTALANPVAVIVRVSAEVTGKTNVRIRYLSNYNSAPKIQTFGTSHSDWFTTGESTSIDAGSGLKPIIYEYMCDCHVPMGSELTYSVASVSGTSPSNPPQLSATVMPYLSDTTLCDAECAKADSRDAGVDLPVGIGTGGAQSTGGASGTGGAIAIGGAQGTGGAQSAGGSVATGGSIATGGSVATGGAMAAGGASGTGGNSAVNSDKPSGWACSFAQGARAGAPFLVLLLGLVAFGLRRRR